MNLARVDQIAAAVLYEGYLLYPYRPSALKNRQRWTFGGVYPQGGGHPWTVQTECLVQGDRCTTLEVHVRFLHLQARQVGQWVGSPPTFCAVEVLQVGEQIYQTWQEAV